ncbi:hypothetical protein BDV29DRAFT_160562 [Aspergillus leporis]|uniref:Uncharacterized protein n=1 Tax=Aspergillus leporis TaxID=41062 RepID=A0A5N5WP66_9EURO|nr:hypothetical protein BDV29DRAFT_160562 [Aspergillus leporis]
MSILRSLRPLTRQIRPSPRGPQTSRLASTNAATGQANISNPKSSNPESQSINSSRGKESRHSDTADTRSVQSPISSQRGPTSEAHEGEEQTSTDAQIKNDPSEPGAKKRENVERAGRRPLGPEDKQ